MVTENDSATKYGPVSFISALANILVLEVVTCFFLPWMPFVALLYFVTPVLVVDWVLAVVLVMRPGTLGQVGRGMLIGSLSAPVSVALSAAGFIVARAIGPI